MTNGAIEQGIRHHAAPCPSHECCQSCLLERDIFPGGTIGLDDIDPHCCHVGADLHREAGWEDV